MFLSKVNLKSGTTTWILTLRTAGRTHLIDLPKYFRKVERKVRRNKEEGEKGIELSSFCSGTQ
jgi:hypothetical protein